MSRVNVLIAYVYDITRPVEAQYSKLNSRLAKKKLKNTTHATVVDAVLRAQ
jgi:hypothetical protein